MEIIVKNCNECPLSQVDMDDNWLYCINLNVHCEMDSIPEKCPLKKEEITIKIK